MATENDRFGRRWHEHHTVDLSTWQMEFLAAQALQQAADAEESPYYTTTENLA